MSFTSRGNTEILVAGLQDRMFTIDVEKGTITRQVVDFHSYWFYAKLLDTIERPLYDHEAESLHLCGYWGRRDPSLGCKNI